MNSLVKGLWIWTLGYITKGKASYKLGTGDKLGNPLLGGKGAVF